MGPLENTLPPGGCLVAVIVLAAVGLAALGYVVWSIAGRITLVWS